jgi:hypothetical protein
MITAQTIYGVPILVKTFTDSKAARLWAEQEGERYGCARIIKETPNGPRTIWRPAAAERVAA